MTYNNDAKKKYLQNLHDADEIAAELKWEKLFAKSLPQLEKMAQQALQDYHAGRTLPLDDLWDESLD
ncbi:MAG: hypothetical protein ACPG7F_16490 [Aggregatilineales bacterium]